MTPKEREIVKEAASTMQHAFIFIQTKEKMYSVGVELYEKALSELWKLLDRPVPTTPSPDFIPTMGHLKLGLTTMNGEPTLVVLGFGSEHEVRLFAHTLINEGLFRPVPKDLQ